MRIYIIGFMGSGKTVFGKKLAEAMKFEFVDLDELFEHRYKISVDNFFDKYGEAEFRLLEHKLLTSTTEMDNVVISTGGGTPCYNDNMDFINNNGMSVYIKVSPDVLYKRLQNSRKPRPLLKKFQGSELMHEIRRLIELREPDYSKAKFTINDNQLTVHEVIQLMLYKS